MQSVPLKQVLFAFLFFSATTVAQPLSSQQAITDIHALYRAEFTQTKTLLEQFKQAPLQLYGGSSLFWLDNEKIRCLDY